MDLVELQVHQKNIHEKSINKCGSEVQKEMHQQKEKFKDYLETNEVTTMIKRCNDFGAGGVSVAIGELADGLNINLDIVPEKI